MEQTTTTTEDMSGKWYNVIHYCYLLVFAFTEYSLLVRSKTALGWHAGMELKTKFLPLTAMHKKSGTKTMSVQFEHV